MVRTLEIPEFHLWDQLRGKHIPLSFDVEITPRCNYDCRHCYINLPANDTETKQRELSLEEIRSIAQDAVQLGAVWCLITGGEPLLRKDFPEIYVLLKRLGLLVSVFSNASLVTPEHAALFKKYPPRDIEVTVYGASQATFERVTRRPGSFAAFQRGLSLLLGCGVGVRLKAMVLRSNVHELDEISRFCREHTKDFYRFDPFLCLRNNRDPVRNTEIRAERLSPEEIVALGEDAEFGTTERPAEDRMIDHRDTNYLFHCGAGEDSFSVTFDGHLRLCSSLCHPDCEYDLRQGNLRDAWQEFVPRVRDTRSCSPEYLEKCATCKLAAVNLCRWCPAKAYSETGEMERSVDYFCRVAHAQAAAFRLSSNRGCASPKL
jgi:radical SAM protein with 4Fe4S-binding SPASM domain